MVDAVQRVRLAELCASTSLFTDLGTGQPAEHGLRTCVVAMRLAEALGLDDDDRCEVFYVTLLRFLGCTADAHHVAEMAGGNDVRLLGGMATVTMGSPGEELAQMIRLVGEGMPLPRRMVALARALADPAGKDPLLQAHCEIAARLAKEMGLPQGVVSALEVAYARWDGRGVPRGVAGDSIPVAMQVAIVARDVELWGRETDDDTAMEVLRRRKGRAYSPEVVDAALEVGVDGLRDYPQDLWEAILDSEPNPWLEVVSHDIDRALAALGDFADLKAPELAGHSRRVARITSDAATIAALDPSTCRDLGRAGSVHDLGMVAVPVGVLRAPPSPGTVAWERIRMHPMWTQRILERCTGLEPVATMAGRHHERADGSGYPAGISGTEPAGVGLLVCADVYDELTSPAVGAMRRDPTDAAEELGRLAASGALRIDDVKAVLEAVQVASPLVEVERPAGLTEREVDVLTLMAKGDTNRQIAVSLGISPKTVGTHVEHIYSKLAVKTRAGATLFAVQNGLV